MTAVGLDSERRGQRRRSGRLQDPLSFALQLTNGVAGRPGPKAGRSTVGDRRVVPFRSAVSAAGKEYVHRHHARASP